MLRAVQRRQTILDLDYSTRRQTILNLDYSTLRESDISFERHRMPDDVEESTVETRSTRSSIRPPTSPSSDSKTPLTPEESPPHTRRKRANLDDAEPSPDVVCICQPDPKIPRPRNAFILYRQHHQSKVIAEHPGLANPEISKIIGEQWRAESQATKEIWKGLANDEKARHQQQYPTYRYQPRRNTRRGSIEAPSDKTRCVKCGGRSAYPASPSSSTPVTRTLPVLNDLNLQSPMDEPLSPNKRRRIDQPVYMYRAMPPRYTVAPYPYPTTPRRESLPSLISPMAPPPRPGYQQHRLSQGHDRSLTLPPLQTQPPQNKSVRETIMEIPLSDKLGVLRRIAPPSKVSITRGPLIAVEGDSLEAVNNLARWLVDATSARLVDSPDVTTDEESAMADYHMLAAEWLRRSKSLANELSCDVEARKPVLIIPAYSLHATNVFSCRIPITDMYGIKEHWQWSATLWRGIIGPDLTIYVKDDPDERRSVEFSEHERLFIVKRSKIERSDELQIDDATLRRVGFEIGEWIRAYGTQTKAG